MNDLKKYYDLNNYNFFENNKLITLEFNLDDVVIYELIASGYILDNIANDILNKYIDEINIDRTLKSEIKKYINDSNNTNNTNNGYNKKRRYIQDQLKYNLQKYEDEIKIDTFVTEYIKSNNEYVKDFSLWVNLEKLKKQVKRDKVGSFQLYDVDRKINNINNINKLNYNNNNKIKIYLSLTQNFVGLITIIIIKKLFFFNFLSGTCIPKKENNIKITINKNIISLNEQKYYLRLNNDHLDNPTLSDFFYNYEINLEKNKILFNFRCVWKNIFYINFFKLATLYSEKVKKIESKSYSQNLTLLLNSELNNGLRDKLYYIIKNIVDKIDNQSDLNNLNEKLDYINDYLLDNQKKYNFLKIIPIKKDETKQIYQKDFLLINFNEEKKSFDDNDCMSMLIKILIEEPSFIIVSTQDCKTGGKGHYQHILGEKLKDNGYDLLVKNTIDNMRMRIYYNTKKVKFNKSEQKYKYRIMQGGDLIPSRIKQIFKKSNNLHIKENFSNSSNNSKNKNFNKDLFLIKNYGRKESIDKKYGHGLVFMRLEISKNDSFTKFIFINCDLSLNRESELENIVNDFKLVDYWRKGYNIFFCGSFNIEAFPFPIKSKNIIKEYSTNISINKKKSSKQFITIDKLAIFLKNKIQTSISNNNIIFQLLLDSIEKLGIHPTYKYIKDESKKQVDFYNDIIDYTNKLKDTNIDKPNRYIIKFLNIPKLLEKIKDSKKLVYEYFKILIELNLLAYSYRIVNGRRSYNKNITEKIINYILNMKNKNFINKKTFNEIIKKYNINDKNKYIKSMINFSEELNKQRKPSEQKKIIDDYLKKFINNKDSFEKTKTNIKKILKDKKDIVKLDYECEKFIKKLITNKLLKKDENNNIFIEKKRDDLLEKYNEIFNTESNKIIPYQQNRILYAISNDIPVCNSNVKKCYYNPIIPNSFDFEVYLFPDKSSHKLTTLSFKIYEEGNIISKKNNRTLIPEVQETNYKNNLEEIDPIVGKNISSNTHVIPTEIVSNIIKKIEKKKKKNN